MLGEQLVNENETYNFTSNASEILTELNHSKNHQNMVALMVPNLGAGLFITAIDNIIETGSDPVIVVKQYDVSGLILEKNKILLSEISSLCALRSKWKNPYIKSCIHNAPFIEGQL
jgi:acetate kinase